MPYTYILRCADGTLYAGWTNDLERRLRAHRQGKASRYTRARLPVSLVYEREYTTATEARQQEAAIRRLARRQKLELINGSRS
ncbi:MAG TPA: GIY-YIG nuclease family protein [Anaerolineae bacterium]|jgi:putative endonuclease|nr:GIY-YIG nuclease family protein [Anaerolineae bacterium]